MIGLKKVIEIDSDESRETVVMENNDERGKKICIEIRKVCGQKKERWKWMSTEDRYGVMEEALWIEVE